MITTSEVGTATTTSTTLATDVTDQTQTVATQNEGTTTGIDGTQTVATRTNGEQTTSPSSLELAATGSAGDNLDRNARMYDNCL